MLAVLCVPDLLLFLRTCIGVCSQQKEGLVWVVAQRKREQICTINFGERLHPRLRTKKMRVGRLYRSHFLLAFTAMALFSTEISSRRR
jgi:hypothetical protein